MTIRHLALAALLVSAGAAHAGTIPTQPGSQSTFVNGWTTANGTDVLGSGVLQGNLNLVGGVAHSANGGLADALLGKVAGNVDGATTLVVQRGIEASYLLAKGHGILAASLGPGKSVVGSANGAVVTDGLTKAPIMVGGGGNTVGAAPGAGSTGSQSGKPSVPGSNTSGGTGANNNIPTNNPAANLDQGNSNGAGNAIGVGTGTGNGIGNSIQVEPAAVPEPSSIALMMLGMAGVCAVTRRRRR